LRRARGRLLALDYFPRSSLDLNKKKNLLDIIQYHLPILISYSLFFSAVLVLFLDLDLIPFIELCSDRSVAFLDVPFGFSASDEVDSSMDKFSSSVSTYCSMYSSRFSTGKNGLSEVTSCSILCRMNGCFFVSVSTCDSVGLVNLRNSHAYCTAQIDNGRM